MYLPAYCPRAGGWMIREIKIVCGVLIISCSVMDGRAFVNGGELETALKD